MKTAIDSGLPNPSEANDPLESDLAAAWQLRAIDELRDGLVHDIRSPLNTIVLNVAVLRTLLDGDGASRAGTTAGCLESITTSISRLQVGLTELLSLTEPPDTVPHPFDLDELVQETATFVRAQGKQKSVSFDIELSAEQRSVHGRRAALRQALIQLLILALHNTSSGETIELRTRPTDTGSLVEIRHQGSDANTSPLAPGVEEKRLSLARLLIESDGGTLEFASKPDVSLFTLRLNGVED